MDILADSRTFEYLRKSAAQIQPVQPLRQFAVLKRGKRHKLHARPFQRVEIGAVVKKLNALSRASPMRKPSIRGYFLGATGRTGARLANSRIIGRSSVSATCRAAS